MLLLKMTTSAPADIERVAIVNGAPDRVIDILVVYHQIDNNTGWGRRDDTAMVCSERIARCYASVLGRAELARTGKEPRLHPDGGIFVINTDNRVIRVRLRAAPRWSEYHELPPSSFVIYAYDADANSRCAIPPAWVERAGGRLAICSWSRERCWCGWCSFDVQLFDSLDVQFDRDRSWYTPTSAGVGVVGLLRHIIDELTTVTPRSLRDTCWSIVVARRSSDVPPGLREEFKTYRGARERFDAAPVPIDPNAIRAWRAARHANANAALTDQFDAARRSTARR
jgi:hypothetical protein